MKRKVEADWGLISIPPRPRIFARAAHSLSVNDHGLSIAGQGRLFPFVATAQ